MKFTKMQGAGNDYVYVNCFEEKVENAGEAAKFISDRHFGIGSDGLVLICPSDIADFRMEMYNADGTQAEMCGNASRCVGKYVHDRGLTDKTTVTLETLAGIKILELHLGSGGDVETVTVNMGAPQLTPSEIPVNAEGDSFIDREVTVDGKAYKVTCVSMGNPHAVTLVDSVDAIEIEKIGPKFENHEIFPARTNTEFIELVDKNTIKMRVWERGAGETLACGTGACGAMAACNLLGHIGDVAKVELIGGTLEIRWDKEENSVYMTGPAKFVFDGTIEI
jgi:diaminopimelate epimerase